MSNNKLLRTIKNAIPKSKVKLSNGKTITIRAFTVKEIRELLDEGSTVKDVRFLELLNECIDGKEDAKQLPNHDIEKLFVEVFKLTKGDPFVPVKYHCHNVVNGVECGTLIDEKIDLNQIQVIDEMPTTITLDQGITLNMRYPTALEIEYFGDDFKDIINLSMRCVESVDTGSEVLTVGADLTPEDLTEVLEYMSANSIEQLADFVSKIPTVQTAFPLACPKCGHSEVIHLSGLLDLFMSL